MPGQLKECEEEKNLRNCVKKIGKNHIRHEKTSPPTLLPINQTLMTRNKMMIAHEYSDS